MTLGPLDEITHVPFEAQTGSAFTLTDGAGTTIALVLSEVRRVGDRPATWMKRDPFRLWFDAPTDAAIPANVYHLSHPDLGPIGDVLITPVFDPERPGVPAYEVVFN